MNFDKYIPHQLKMIDNEKITSIHEASLEVLSTTGVYFEEPEAVDLLTSAGAEVNTENFVRIPPSLVERAIESAPNEITMYRRDGAEALHLKPGNVYFGTGSDCLYVLDVDTGARRPAVKHDIEIFSRLSDALPNIDFVLSMAYASDVPEKTADLHHFQAMLANTIKPIFFTAVHHENLLRIFDIGAEVVGGVEALKRRPFLAHFGMPSPPLRHSMTALKNLIASARASLPIVYASGTQVGMSGPMTLAGSTVSSNCDVISALVVHQLANPGAPYIYGVCIAPIDMKTTIEAYGAPEHYPGDLINTQLAQFYGLPTWGYAGSTDSKLLDLQAAIEYQASTILGLLSGCNLLHDVGYLESGLLASCESILFGNEVIEFTRRMLPEVKVNEDTLSTEMIKRVGPGGMFLAEEHTLNHFRDFWYSPLIDRRRYQNWVTAGSQSMIDRIRDSVHEILTSHKAEPLDKSVIDHIEETISWMEAKV